MRIRLSTLRDWVILVFAAIGIGLLPWAIWLSASLNPHHETNRWDLAWSGFDTGLAALFILTAVAAYRRSPWVGALAAATGTVLVVDAWFDVVLESHADELRSSIMLALFAELPIAAFCFWIAMRTERFVERALHLAAPRESAPESDLVGVLEVPPDGEAAGETRHADPPA
jgi:hypothetical protein